MQRLHAEDLAGHVRSRGSWDILTIPAIATTDERIPLGAGRWHDRKAGDLIDPSRDPEDVLDAIKESIGSFAFSAQYQQEPLPPTARSSSGAGSAPMLETPNLERARIVQSWDCASKNTEFSDYSVCTTWAVLGTDYYLLDVFRKRLNFPELVAAAKAEGERWKLDEVLIEDAAAGIQLIQTLRFDRPTRMPRLSTSSPSATRSPVRIPRPA